MVKTKMDERETWIQITKRRHPLICIAMALLSMSIVVQSMMVTGSLNVCISTIERLYHYNSFHVAFIDMLYNVGFSISAFVLGYMIINRKMRLIGFGMVMIAIGCIAFILPVFLIRGITNDNDERSYLCKSKQLTKKVECIYGSYAYLVIMCLAYFVIGIGAAPLYTVAVKFIQENTDPQQSGLFLGIYYTFAAVGPALLFVSYSFVIKIPLMISRNTHDILTPHDENWIGAYWIVYAVGGVFSVIVSLLLITFPRNPHILSIPIVSESNFKINRFVSISQKVATNPKFILVTMAMFFDGMMNNAVGVFLSKYIEAQFKLTSDKAALYSGVIIVSGAAVGLFLGGLITKVFNLTKTGLIRVITIFSCVGILATSFLFFYCPENPIKGVVYKGNNISFTSQVAADCKCEFEKFLPVCINKTSYYSPCVLGCKVQVHENNSNVFKNCSKELTENDNVIQGRCNTVCKVFPAFMIAGFFCLVVEFFIYTPQITYTIRILDDESRLLGLSIQQILTRLSFMLGPLYQGKLFDMSCSLFRQASSCNQLSNCIDYNLKYLSFSIAIPAAIQKLLSTICLILAVYIHMRLKNNPQEPQDSEIYA